jgi:uncharacterized protein (TIGR03086 family)
MSALPRADHAVDPGLELLERALAYTRHALGTVTPDDLGRPTPCRRWRLADLLAHMEDSLDAFTEGASGTIGLERARPSAAPPLVAVLHTKACALLAAWTRADTEVVQVGGQPVPVPVISRIAALEIAVHGWDAGRATGRGADLPEDFASELLPTAAVVAREQYDEFGPPVPLPPDAAADVLLLGLLGRSADW